MSLVVLTFVMSAAVAEYDSLVFKILFAISISSKVIFSVDVYSMLFIFSKQF